MYVDDFFQAIKKKDYQTLERMVRIEKRVNLHTRYHKLANQPTPLLLAAEYDSLSIVTLLLRNKAPIDDEDSHGKRAIWWAVKHENLDMVSILTKYRCDVNYLDKETGCTPLYLSIVKSNADIAEALVHGGADVNLRKLGVDALQETPMIKAVQLGNPRIVTLLINCLVDVNSRTKDGLTALHYAVAYRRYNIVEILLTNRCKMYAASKHGVTAMTVAIEHDIPYMVRLLLEFGYDGNKPYKWGETPLEQAINLHSSKSCMTLIANGVSIQRRADKPTYSYFKAAIENRMLDVARVMLLLCPIFAQERWIRTQRYPLALYSEVEFRNWLEERAFKVWSLKELCRAAIFQRLGRFPMDRISKLASHLPRPMLKYLTFPGIIDTSQLYGKISLEQRDCPIDCLVDCTLRTCPPIEVHDDAPLYLPAM